MNSSPSSASLSRPRNSLFKNLLHSFTIFFVAMLAILALIAAGQVMPRALPNFFMVVMIVLAITSIVFFMVGDTEPAVAILAPFVLLLLGSYWDSIPPIQPLTSQTVFAWVLVGTSVGLVTAIALRFVLRALWR